MAISLFFDRKKERIPENFAVTAPQNMAMALLKSQIVEKYL